MHIFPLITYLPNMERVAHRNESCNVWKCILFLWSPISPTWMGLLTEMRIAMYMCILFPWSPISPTWRGLLREMRIAMSMCVYYSLGNLFRQHGGGAHGNENCNVYVYIIPLITYFPEHGGRCSHKWELQCICVCYSLGHVFPLTRRGCSQKWELQCLYVYIIPLITYFQT